MKYKVFSAGKYKAQCESCDHRDKKSECTYTEFLEVVYAYERLAVVRGANLFDITLLMLTGIAPIVVSDFLYFAVNEIAMPYLIVNHILTPYQLK